MRTQHSVNSDTTVISNTLKRVSVTTSRGSVIFWIDLGTWPDSMAASLTVSQSRALRKALKRAERIAQEPRA